MKKKYNPVYFWFSIFALAFIAYQLMQDHLRPNYQGDSELVRYLLGIAPNFFPSIGIPALFVLIIAEVGRSESTGRWWLTNRHITANVLSLIGLLSWEFTQTITAHGRFDWHDVLWTFIGALTFHAIWTLSPARFKEVSK
jgi:hypothetical protein